MKVISKENLINLIPFISDHNSYSSLEENYSGFLECTNCHKVFGNIPLVESAEFAFCPYCGRKLIRGGVTTMKILVEGKLDNLKEVKFKCDRCGCVFVANEMEYRVISENFYGHYTVMCECPCCKMEVLMDHHLKALL